MKVEELEKEKFYTTFSDSDKISNIHIFKFKGLGKDDLVETYGGIRYGRQFDYDGCSFYSGYLENLRPSNQEEINWWNRCKEKEMFLERPKFIEKTLNYWW